MSPARSIKYKCWVNFLKDKGCKQAKGSRHEKWKCPGCTRSIIFRHKSKDIPFPHIKSNLESMGVEVNEFWAWMKKNCS